MISSWPEIAIECLRAVRREHPLVHNITNLVVMNSSANILLALGASPVMAHAQAEVEEMAAGAGALVLNIGTLDRSWIAAMILAGEAANRAGRPVVLDPVGAGATKLRTAEALNILRRVRVALIRGNPSEINALVDPAGKTRGVESSRGPDGVREAARALSEKTGSVVGVSGERDLIVRGEKSIRVANGSPLMTRVTGTGCGLSAAAGAFLAVRKDPLEAAGAAFACYGLAGEKAAASSAGPGSFEPAFLDELYLLSEDEIRAGVRIESEP